MPLDPAVRAFLNERRFAVLATINGDGSPQLTVMWYLLRDDTIILNTTWTRVKGQNLQRDPRIAICVEDGYRFVSVSGAATLNDDQRIAQADIRELAIRYDGQEEGELQMAQFGRQQRVTIRLPLTHVIARGFE
ncbi:MAG TPA: PPOX class F420-dependent oxidoreductase [Ktedonobacterales bacterium]